MASIIHNFLNQFTGGLLFNGQQQPPPDTSNQTGQWNPQDALMDIAQQRFGNDWRGNIVKGIGSKLFSSNPSSDATQFTSED